MDRYWWSRSYLLLLGATGEAALDRQSTQNLKGIRYIPPSPLWGEAVKFYSMKRDYFAKNFTSRKIPIDVLKKFLFGMSFTIPTKGLPRRMLK